MRGLVGTERWGSTDNILFLLAETTVVPTVEFMFTVDLYIFDISD